MADEDAGGGPGAIEVPVSINVEPALEALDQLQAAIEKTEEMARALVGLRAEFSVATDIDSSALSRAPRGEQTAPPPTPPSPAAQAAADVNGDVDARINSGSLVEQIREAIESAFRDPIDVILNVTNLQAIREQLGAISISRTANAGSDEGAQEIPASTVVPAAGRLNETSRAKIAAILASTSASGSGSGSGSTLHREIKNIAMILRQNPDLIKGLTLPEGDGPDTAVEILRHVFPGAWTFNPSLHNPEGRPLGTRFENGLVAQRGLENIISPMLWDTDELGDHITNALQRGNWGDSESGLLGIVRAIEAQGIQPAMGTPRIAVPETPATPAPAAQAAAGTPDNGDWEAQAEARRRYDAAVAEHNTAMQKAAQVGRRKAAMLEEANQLETRANALESAAPASVQPELNPAEAADWEKRSADRRIYDDLVAKRQDAERKQAEWDQQRQGLLDRASSLESRADERFNQLQNDPDGFHMWVDEPIARHPEIADWDEWNSSTPLMPGEPERRRGMIRGRGEPVDDQVNAWRAEAAEIRGEALKMTGRPELPWVPDESMVPPDPGPRPGAASAGSAEAAELRRQAVEIRARVSAIPLVPIPPMPTEVPKPGPRPGTPDAAARVAAEAETLPPVPQGDARLPESPDMFVRRLVQSAINSPDSETPKTYDFDRVRQNGPMDREQLFSFLSYKSGLGEIQGGKVVSRPLDLSEFDQIPQATEDNPADFDAYIGGLNGRLPGLGENAESVFRALKALSVVGKRTDRNGGTSYFVPEIGSPDYAMLEERMGKSGSRRFGFMSTGERVEAANPIDLLGLWMNAMSGGDASGALSKLTQTPSKDVGRSLASNITRTMRNLSLSLNRQKESRDEGENTQEASAGSYVGATTYGNLSLEGTARLDLQLAKVARRIQQLDAREERNGFLTPSQLTLREEYEDRAEDLMQRGAMLPLTRAQAMAQAQVAREAEGEASASSRKRIEYGFGLSLDELASRVRPDFAGAMQEGRVPKLWDIAAKLMKDVEKGATEGRPPIQYGPGRGPLIGGGPESTLSQMRRKMAEAEDDLIVEMQANGASQAEAREALTHWGELRDAMSQWILGYSVGGAAMPGGQWNREGPFTEGPIQRSQAGNGGYTRGEPRQATPIDTMRQKLEGRRVTEIGAAATTSNFRSERIRRERPGYVAANETNTAQTGELEIERQKMEAERELEARREYGFTRNTGIRNASFPWLFEGVEQGDSDWQARRAAAEKQYKKAVASPLLYPDELWRGLDDLVSRDKLEERAEGIQRTARTATTDTGEPRPEYVPIGAARALAADFVDNGKVGPVETAQRGFDADEKALRDLQARAKTIYRWAARKAGYRKGGEWTLELQNATRELIAAMPLESQATGGHPRGRARDAEPLEMRTNWSEEDAAALSNFPELLRQEAIGFSMSRAPYEEDKLVPKGTGRTPASGDRVGEIYDANAGGYVPEREPQRGSFPNFYESLGIEPTPEPILGRSPGNDTPLRPPSGGDGGGDGGRQQFAGEGTYLVHVVNFNELQGMLGAAGGGSSPGAAAATAAPTANMSPEARQANAEFRIARAGFRMQATQSAQNALRRDVDWMRDNGWSDQQIYNYAQRQGIYGIEGIISRDSIGSGGRSGGAPLGRYTGYGERQFEPSDEFIQASANLRLASGKLQQRSIPTTMVALAENLFGNREEPIKRLIEAQRKLSDFGRVDARKVGLEKEIGGAQRRLDSGVREDGRPLSVRARQSIERDIADYSRQLEELAPQHKELSDAVDGLTRNAVTASDALKNLGAGAVGGVVGAIAGTLISAGAQAAFQFASMALGPSTERALGDPSTTARVQGALGGAIAQSGGYTSAAVSGQLAQTAIGPQSAAALSPELEARALNVAASQQTMAQLDLIRSAARINNENQNYQGYDKSLLDTTGGVLGTFINGQPSTREQLYDAMKVLEEVTPSSFGAGGAGSALKLEQEFGEGRAQKIEVAKNTLASFIEQVERADGSLQVLADSANIGSEANEDFARSAEKAGRTDWARLIRATGMTVSGYEGKDPFRAALDAYNRGSIKIPAREILQSMESQLKAQRFAQIEQLRNQKTTFIPEQWAIQQAGSPVTPDGRRADEILRAMEVGGLRADSDTVSKIMERSAGIKQRKTAGIEAAKETARLNLPTQDAREFASALDTVLDIGNQIASLRFDSGVKQAQLSANQFKESMRQAKIAAQDARGLAGMRPSAAYNADGYVGNLGSLQRSEFFLGQRAARLSQAMSQRQINFQTAIAGFTAPGLTPEERAARIQQAKIEASYAQKQLDIQKQMTNIQAAEFTITSARAVTMTANQVDLAEQGQQTALDVAGNESLIAQLTADLQEPMETVQAAYSTSAQIVTDKVSAIASVIQSTSDSIDTVRLAMDEMAPAIERWAENLGIKAPDDQSGRPIQLPGYARPGYGADGKPSRLPGYANPNYGVTVPRRPFQEGGGATINVTINADKIGGKDDGREIVKDVVTSLNRQVQVLGLRPS